MFVHSEDAGYGEYELKWDVYVPNKKADEVLQKIRKAFPDLPFMVMSDMEDGADYEHPGYKIITILDHFHNPEEDDNCAKKFSAEMVALEDACKRFGVPFDLAKESANVGRAFVGDNREFCGQVWDFIAP